MRRIALVVLALVALGCGGAARPATVSSRWTAPALFAHVPDDTPYVIASVEAPDVQARSRVIIALEDAIGEALAETEELEPEDYAELPPPEAALMAILELLRGAPREQWLPRLGLGRAARFVIYGHSLWPVLRVEITDGDKLRLAIERTLHAAGVRRPPRRRGDAIYWNELVGKSRVVAAIRPRELALMIVPAGDGEAAERHVLGLDRPARSLATTTTIPDLLGRHRIPGLAFAYVDTGRVVDALTREPRPIDRTLRELVGPIPAGCRDDLARIARTFPRFVSGYRLDDGRRFEVYSVLETAPWVPRELAALRTTAPVVRDRPAVLAWTLALDAGRLVTWLEAQARGLQARPLTCSWLAPIQDATGGLLAALAAPSGVWAEARRLHAITLELDPLEEGDQVRGAVTLAGTRLAGAVQKLSPAPIATDGRPIPLPATLVGSWARGAHLAVTDARVVFAFGSGSDDRARTGVAAREQPSPLMVMAGNLRALRALLAALDRPSDRGMDLDDFVLVIDPVDTAATTGIEARMTGTFP